MIVSISPTHEDHFLERKDLQPADLSVKELIIVSKNALGLIRIVLLFNALKINCNLAHEINIHVPELGEPLYSKLLTDNIASHLCSQAVFIVPEVIEEFAKRKPFETWVEFFEKIRA